GPVESVSSWDLGAGEQESLLSTDSNDSEQKPPLPDAGDSQSVQSMSQLLDKLAKENQEIRLMQAELQVGAQCRVSVLYPGAALLLPALSQPPTLPQAHKEDLQALLHRSEGEAAAAGAQQQSLAAENARLRA
ncbi:PBIP1 protein, partial [Oenanthe oenanthe]|nr:PBIP1 protein [Oenanthe oenanthe]